MYFTFTFYIFLQFEYISIYKTSVIIKNYNVRDNILSAIGTSVTFFIV